MRQEERGRSRVGRRRRIGVVVAMVVLAMDQASKAWAVASLASGPPVPVLGHFLTLKLIYNGGSAFSLGEQATWLFAVISAAAVIALARWVSTARTTVGALVLGLLLGGAVTHLLDRLLRPPGFGRGKVVDFIDYNAWFIGNLADIALVTGAVALGLLLATGREPLAWRTAHEPAPESRPTTS